MDWYARSFIKCIVLTLSQLDPIPVDKITKWEAEFRAHLTGSQSALLQKISEGVINPELEAEIKKVGL